MLSDHSKQETGSVLYMVMGAVLLISLFSIVIMRTLGRHSRASGTQDEIQEVEMMRRVLLDDLDCQQTVQPPQTGLAACGGEKYILKDRHGTALYPQNSGGSQSVSWRNPAGKILTTWEIRTSCKSNSLYVERKQLRNDGSRSFLSSFLPMWPSGIEPELCKSYFEKQTLCSGKYNISTGGAKESPNCCRIVEASGSGSASAVCQSDEYLHLGGAWCGSSGGHKKSDLDGARQTAQRCVLDENALAIGHIGQGSALGVSITNPSLPGIHSDSAFPAIMDARLTFPKTKSMLREKLHGGFLLQSGYSSFGSSATVDAWVASCKMDDWQEAFPTAARAYCCPKKP